MQALRGTTIEEHYPGMRRKNKSMLQTFLKHTFANSFLTFVEQSPLSQISDRPTVKESEEMINQHYKKIHNIIDSLDQHLTRRLENHQNEVFSLVKGEIEEMREETREIVLKLNEAIKEKNTEDQIWKLSNQLDYFKAQTYKLFQQNKKVREEMGLMRKQIKEYQIELENSDKLMQKLKRNCMKAKVNHQKISKNIQQKMHNISHSQLNKREELNNNSSRNKKLRTQASQQISLPFFKQFGVNLQQKQSIVDIKTTQKSPSHHPIITQIDQIDPLYQLISIPNSSLPKPNSLPSVHLQKCSSEYIDQDFQQNHTIDRYIQTDPVQFFSISERQHDGTNIFSKTSCIQHPGEPLHKQKNIDLIKNGFFIRTYNARSGKSNSSGVQAAGGGRKQSRHERYMTTVLNKSKIQQQSEREVRVRTKTTTK